MPITELTTLRSGGSLAFRILQLEGDISDELGTYLGASDEYVAPKLLGSSPVFKQVLLSVTEATHLIVEFDYFDADFRSTAALTLSRRHDPLDLRTDRLLFVKLADGVTPSVEDPLKSLDQLDDGHISIIGYTVVNGDPGGMVGRSLLPSPLEMERVLHSVHISRHVRTAVTETISLAGKLMEVSGVPFMRQDGNILTCAHVAAWSAHYNSVLRGLARRRHTADFHTLPGNETVVSRSIPSDGLTDWQVATLLEKIGLPAEVIDRPSALKQARCADWYDRERLIGITKAMRDLATCELSDELGPNKLFNELRNDLERQQTLAPPPPPDAQPATVPKDKGIAHFLQELNRFWIRESLTTAVCRHLNSGFPAIVVQPPHAWVVNGYLRNKDMIEADDGGGNEVAAFISADDQVGPYVLNDVRRIAESIDADACTVLLPLPPGVWLRGFDAERLGTQFFRSSLSAVLDQADEGNGDRPKIRQHHSSLDLEIVSESLNQTLKSAETEGYYSVRSYVITATDFRRGIERRTTDNILQAKVRLAKLPKFVWVVEIMERSTRDNSKDPAVVGEVVLDASIVDQRETRALITHLPGMVQVAGREHAGDWHVLESDARYKSGRYHAGKDWMTDAQSTVTRWKYSI